MRVFVVILLAWAWFCAVACAQDRTAIDAGEALYEEHCLGCHGEKLRSPGTLTADQRARFDKFVMEGKGQMPPWRGTLNQSEVDQLWAYIRANADDK
jgi:mono/diheme cytochrome c family protein